MDMDGKRFYANYREFFGAPITESAWLDGGSFIQLLRLA